jgi:molecular chaperone DnaK
MYNAQAASGAQGEPQAGQQANANAGGGSKQDGEVTDVDFEEVK